MAKASLGALVNFYLNQLEVVDIRTECQPITFELFIVRVITDSSIRPVITYSNILYM